MDAKLFERYALDLQATILQQAEALEHALGDGKEGPRFELDRCVVCCDITT